MACEGLEERLRLLAAHRENIKAKYDFNGWMCQDSNKCQVYVGDGVGHKSHLLSQQL